MNQLVNSIIKTPHFIKDPVLEDAKNAAEAQKQNIDNIEVSNGVKLSLI